MSILPKKRGRPAKPKVAKPPQQKELFNTKREFLKRNYENFNKWPQGIKILTALFEVIPNIHFWDTYTLPKPYSIFWLIKQEGKAFLLKEFDKFLQNSREIPVAETPERFIIEDKVGEDIVISAKPKSLKEFLK